MIDPIAISLAAFSLVVGAANCVFNCFISRSQQTNSGEIELELNNLNYLQGERIAVDHFKLSAENNSQFTEEIARLIASGSIEIRAQRVQRAEHRTNYESNGESTKQIQRRPVGVVEQGIKSPSHMSLVVDEVISAVDQAAGVGVIGAVDHVASTVSHVARKMVERGQQTVDTAQGSTHATDQRSTHALVGTGYHNTHNQNLRFANTTSSSVPTTEDRGHTNDHLEGVNYSIHVTTDTLGSSTNESINSNHEPI